MKHMKKKTRGGNRFHPFARNAVIGSVQLTGICYLLAGILHAAAAYTPDYFRTLLYRDAALEVAPVTLAAGIVVALICDLVLKHAEDKEE